MTCHPGPASARLYPASRASVPERVDLWRQLQREGFPIFGAWLDVAGPGQIDDWGSFWVTCLEEAAASSALVLYVSPEDVPLRGALVEVGAALSAGRPVYVCADGFDHDGAIRAALGQWMRHPSVCVLRSLDELRERLRRLAEPSPPRS